MPTLLEKAKAIGPKRYSRKPLPKEEVELIKAWINDEITIRQVCKVMGFKSGTSVYIFLAHGMKDIMKRA